MYLNQLTDSDKAAFLALATRMVMADGRVLEHEEALLKFVRHEMGDGITASMEQLMGTVDAGAFSGPRARAIVLMELLTLSYVDDQHHVDEAHVVDQVAAAFGYDAAYLESLHAWARQQAAQMRAAFQLMDAIAPDAG